PRGDAQAPGGGGRRRRGQRPRDDDRPTRLHRPGRGARGARGRVAPASVTYSVFTHLERPDLAERAAQAGDEVWPEYNRHGDVTNAFWRRMRLEFAGLQFVLYDEERDDLVAEGHTIAISWDGTQEDLPAGLDGIFERGFADGPKTALCAMAAEIWPAHQGAGLASE